jgi:hypothetical protein
MIMLVSIWLYLSNDLCPMKMQEVLKLACNNFHAMKEQNPVLLSITSVFRNENMLNVFFPSQICVAV